MAAKPEIPGYEILEPLGEGGMAMVYLAIQENFQRKVAVKILSARLLSDPSFGVRFLREARIVAQLSHQHIVPVFDVGQHGDCHYIAMELLKGGDLKQRLAKGMQLSECLDIVQQIASALHYASEKNFVHRDIKPENILFRENGSAVVSDFGIARSTESETNMTLTGTIIGTPSYMSPEQAQALTLDGRSDLYSLGIILFEMLTGNVPYTADSAISIGLKHITDPIPELPEEVQEFQEIIDKALAKSPEDRFQTGHDFIDALEELEHSLHEGASSTTIISPEALKRHKSASNRRRSTGGPAVRSRSKTGKTGGGRATRSVAARTRSGTRTGSNTRTTRGGQVQPSGLFGKPTLLAASIIGVLAVGGAASWWYSNSSPGSNVSSAEQGAFSKKTLALLEQAKDAMADERWYEPANNSAQYFYSTALALAPSNQEALQGIEALVVKYLDNAQQAIAASDEANAVRWLNQSSQIAFYASDQNLVARQQELRGELFQMQQQNIRNSERKNQVLQLLEEAKAALADNRLSSPAGDNAYDKYQAALALDPQSQTALQGISNIAATFLQQSVESAEKDNFSRARALVAAAIQIDSQHPGLQETQLKINQLEALKQQQQMNLADQKAQTQAEILQQQQQAKENRIKQISSLLAAADADLQADRLQSPPGDNAVQKYRQVLQLEPSNLEALEGLQNVGEKYIVLANAKMKTLDIDQVDGYLNMAQKLVPNSQKLLTARRNLLNAKEDKALQRDLQLQREWQVKQLLAGAKKDVAEGRLSTPMGNNALEKYSQVLTVDAINAEANSGRNKIVDDLAKDTTRAIRAKDFDIADGYINTLARFFPNGSKTRALQNELSKAKQQFAGLQKEKNNLLDRVASLSKKTMTEVNNFQLRSMYNRILQIDDANAVAKAGLKKIAEFDLSLADKAISNRDYEKASTYLATVNKNLPNLAGLAEAKKRLSDAVQAEQKAEELLANVEQEYQKTKKPSDNSVTRNAFKTVYRNILAVKSTDPQNPKIDPALAALESNYVEAIQYYTDRKSFERGGELIADALSMDIPKTALSAQQKIFLALEKEAKEKEKKKRLTRQMGVF
jgi:serine/threonine protein kinase